MDSTSNIWLGDLLTAFNVVSQDAAARQDIAAMLGFAMRPPSESWADEPDHTSVVVEADMKSEADTPVSIGSEMHRLGRRREMATVAEADFANKPSAQVGSPPVNDIAKIVDDRAVGDDHIAILPEAKRVPMIVTAWASEPSLPRATEGFVIAQLPMTPLLSPRSAAAVLYAMLASTKSMRGGSTLPRPRKRAQRVGPSRGSLVCHRQRCGSGYKF